MVTVWAGVGPLTLNTVRPVAPSVTLPSRRPAAGGVKVFVYVQVTVSPPARFTATEPVAAFTRVALVPVLEVQLSPVSDQPGWGTSVNVHGAPPAGTAAR